MVTTETAHSFIITDDNSSRKGQSNVHGIELIGVEEWVHGSIKFQKKSKVWKSIFFSSLVEEIGTPKWYCGPISMQSSKLWFRNRAARK